MNGQITEITQMDDGQKLTDHWKVIRLITKWMQ